MSRAAPGQTALFGAVSSGAFEPDPDGAFDHLDPAAEAVVYMVTEANSAVGKCLFVMRRDEAQRLCSDPRSAGRGRGSRWSYAFTTHFRGWRSEPDAFRADDGRMDGVLADLGIVPIHRGEHSVSRTLEVRP